VVLVGLVVAAVVDIPLQILISMEVMVELVEVVEEPLII
jgi:hypothetical protein